MAHWRSTLQLKDLLDQDAPDHDAHALKVGPVAAQRIRAGVGKFPSEYRDELLEAAQDFEDCETCEQFNDALRRFYDIADASRVWIE